MPIGGRVSPGQLRERQDRAVPEAEGVRPQPGEADHADEVAQPGPEDPHGPPAVQQHGLHRAAVPRLAEAGGLPGPALGHGVHWPGHLLILCHHQCHRALCVGDQTQQPEGGAPHDGWR